MSPNPDTAKWWDFGGNEQIEAGVQIYLLLIRSGVFNVINNDELRGCRITPLANPTYKLRSRSCTNSDSQLVSLYGELVKGKFTRDVEVVKGKLNKDASAKAIAFVKK